MMMTFPLELFEKNAKATGSLLGIQRSAESPPAEPQTILGIPVIDTSAKYRYSFIVRLDETHEQPKLVRNVFELLQIRTEMILTEYDFQKLRTQLAARRFTLREIERVPYHEPETVI